VKLERCAELLVPIRHRQQNRPATVAELASLLADPPRVLRQLLSRELLEPLPEPGRFLYIPRPLELPGLRLAPQVHFCAQWQAPVLAISLIDYELPQLASLASKIRYGFAAELQTSERGLALRAQATLELATGAGGLGLPQPVLAFLGHRTLELIFGRLERRCRRNLPGLLPQQGGLGAEH